MKRARVRRKRRKSLKRMKKPRAKRRKRRRATRRRRLPQRASAKCQHLRPGRPVPRPPLLAVMRRINGRCRPESIPCHLMVPKSALLAIPRPSSPSPHVEAWFVSVFNTKRLFPSTMPLSQTLGSPFVCETIRR
jgi:hypothetical protein